jgi:ectoine hydroxylase-related dioxygenase (phytanoyl-CoA dioxygenase family)
MVENGKNWHRARFELFGFEVFRGLLSDFTEDIFREVEEDFSVRARGSAERRFVEDYMGASPALARAVSKSGIAELAADLLDAPALYLFGDASEYHADTSWHVETSAESARLIKFVFYDRPTSARNGALRILPGSHRSQANYRTEGFRDEEIPGWAIETAPGDVIAFDARVQHAVLGETRRQVAVTFAAEPTAPAARMEIAGLVLADRTVV